MQSRRARAGAIAACSTLVALSLAGPAAAAGGDPDGAQPLPGYTVDNPPLAPLTVDGRPTRVIQGIHEHAAFDLEVPPNWNGKLVIWAHGFTGAGTVLRVDPPSFGLRETFVKEGYAWAASSYTRNGYDAGVGVSSSHDLAEHAAALLGHHPSRTYIAGVSMGGHVIGRSLEQYPHYYDGALPMCGQLGDNRLFDYYLDVNLVAQALSGVRAYPAPADYGTTDLPQIMTKLGLAGLQPGQTPDNELGRELQQITVQLSGGPRPGADPSFASYSTALLSFAPGGPSVAQNLHTRYTPTTPVDVNPIIERVGPASFKERRSMALNSVPRIVGKPRVPVLSLHDAGDLFVPLSMEQIYAKEVARNGQSDLLVQRAIRGSDHCDFTPAEAGKAWKDLQTWVEAGGAKAPASARPEGDDITDPKAVTDPSFGCRFTDPTASRNPARRFFPACPVNAG
ncbi:hypothetical protein [Streptomyces sp. NPDC102462]|uniref:hypothetical protein n=1 Tax=Streptomyces sp. NPDC102462 TaxID=3366178 RepID=UPI00381554B0